MRGLIEKIKKRRDSLHGIIFGKAYLLYLGLYISSIDSIAQKGRKKK